MVGSWPNRFAAVASSQGGNLATEALDSPHRYAPKLEDRFVIVAVKYDASYLSSLAMRLLQALQDAHVRYSAEKCPAARSSIIPSSSVRPLLR